MSNRQYFENQLQKGDPLTERYKETLEDRAYPEDGSVIEKWERRLSNLIVGESKLVFYQVRSEGAVSIESCLDNEIEEETKGFVFEDYMENNDSFPIFNNGE